MPKIYTKKGDKGRTELLGCSCTKDCVSLRVIGELDELNCVLGIAGAYLKEKKLSRLLDMLVSIQRDLFLAGAEVAALQSTVIPPTCVGGISLSSRPTPTKSGEWRDPLKFINSSKVVELEKQIDAWWGKLPELKRFVLPGGHLVAAHLHLARAVCRRVERELVALGRKKKVRPELYQYFNRLSDWLFTAARWVNEK